jgi:hypothetical protein
LFSSYSLTQTCPFVRIKELLGVLIPPSDFSRPRRLLAIAVFFPISVFRKHLSFTFPSRFAGSFHFCNCVFG